MENEIRTPFQMLNWFSELFVLETWSPKSPAEELSDSCLRREVGLTPQSAHTGSHWLMRGEQYNFKDFESQLFIIKIKLYKISNQINKFKTKLIH